MGRWSACQPASPPASSAISESATLAVDAKAKAMKAAGRPVIGFGAGEPDFPTPGYIVEARRRGVRRPAVPQVHPGGGPARAQQAIAAKTLRDSGYQVEAAPGAGHQRRQAGRLRDVRHAARPGRRGARAGPYWTTYPEAIKLAGGVRSTVRHRRDAPATWPGSSSSRRPAPTAPRCCCSSRRPTRPGRSTRPSRSRRSAAGPPSTACGWSPTRSTSTWSTAARVLLDPGPGAGAGGPVRGAERRGQDLRDDRLAGRLDDRPEGRDQGGDQPAVPRHLERLQRGPGRRAGRRLRRPVGRGRDARGVRPAPADDGAGC